jgi:transposase
MNTDGLSLPDDVEQLKTMIAARDAVIVERETAILQHKAVITERESVIAQNETVISQREAVIAQNQSVIAQNEAVITSLQDEVQRQQSKLDRMHQELARLLRQHYGPRQERIDPNQLTLFTAEELAELVRELQQGREESVATDDGFLEDDDSVAEPRSAKPKGHGRRPIPPQIPRQTIVHELTDEERLCPCCGELRAEIGREISEQLECVPARLMAIRHERVRYACRGCEEHVVLAPKPPQPIDKGLPGPGFLAHLALSKYGDYLPLYRLSFCGLKPASDLRVKIGQVL